MLVVLVCASICVFVKGRERGGGGGGGLLTNQYIQEIVPDS